MSEMIMSSKLASILRGLGMEEGNGISEYKTAVKWFKTRWGYKIFVGEDKGGFYYSIYNLDEKKYEVKKQRNGLNILDFEKCIESAIYFVIRFCKVREIILED